MFRKRAHIAFVTITNSSGRLFRVEGYVHRKIRLDDILIDNHKLRFEIYTLIKPIYQSLRFHMIKKQCLMAAMLATTVMFTILATLQLIIKDDILLIFPLYLLEVCFYFLLQSQDTSKLMKAHRIAENLTEECMQFLEVESKDNDVKTHYLKETMLETLLQQAKEQIEKELESTESR